MPGRGDAEASRFILLSQPVPAKAAPVTDGWVCEMKLAATPCRRTRWTRVIVFRRQGARRHGPSPSDRVAALRAGQRRRWTCESRQATPPLDEARYSPAFDVLALSDGDRRARTLQISPGTGMYRQLAAIKFPCETQERRLLLNFWWSLRTAA